MNPTISQFCFAETQISSLCFILPLSLKCQRLLLPSLYALMSTLEAVHFEGAS